jgi:hypothetical protein
MSEIKTRSQSIDFLGFLRSQLSGLQGIPTLCYELIQNADDVKAYMDNKAAERITFDVCDDALWVENDGVFRPIDFDRMERVSWGNKREEENTTGAFGIGFISVYQITDSPELFSSNQHWQFQPQAPEAQRIIVQEEENQFTRFRLPWAFEASQVRKELGISPVKKEQLDTFAAELIFAIERAALFLNQILYLEVKRSGTSLRKIQVYREDDCLLLDDGKQIIKWRILKGTFDAQAREMRGKSGNLIEAKRRSHVQLAIPETPATGSLYAFLPSETHTGLPFHINADFYPSADRKRILFDSDYKSEWNRLAIRCAAETLAGQLDQVLEIFSPVSFWDFADRVNKSSNGNLLSPAFGDFWKLLKIPIAEKPTVLTSSNKKLPPSQVYYLDSDELQEARDQFEELGIHSTHLDLRSYRNLLLDTGSRLLKISDVANALQKAGLIKRTELTDMPKSLRSESGWNIFWSALNKLWEPSPQLEKRSAELSLKDYSLAFGSDGALWPAKSLYKADEITRKFFSKISKVIWLESKSSSSPLPALLVPQFELEHGLSILEDLQTQLPDLWKAGLYDPAELYEWLEHFRDYIRHGKNKERLRSLTVWPTAEGGLKPLNDLYLAGDFDDPLQLAELIDVEALGGNRELLERFLETSQLDFATYVKEWVPSVIRRQNLTDDQRIRLLEVLAENLGKIQGNYGLQDTLSELPLIWCQDTKFYGANTVYFDSPNIREVLGSETHITQLPPAHSDAIKALYEWLGVTSEPRADAVIAQIKSIISSSPDEKTAASLQKIFSYLAGMWSIWADDKRQQFEVLRRINWLPGTKSYQLWYSPRDVFTIYQSYLFESQGNFLRVDQPTQRRANELAKFLGMPTEPSVGLVVSHLLDCSKRNLPANQEIYTFLSRHTDDNEIKRLQGQPCLYLKFENGEEKYFRPDQVFWEDHPFGKFRFRLGTDFGKHKALFDRMGVKEKPDSQDALKVLGEISQSRFAISKIAVTEEIDLEQIIVSCWKLINQGLDSGNLKANEIKRVLGKIKSIPGANKLLTLPENLFFDDRPGWGESFELVQHNLIPRIEGAWMAMEAAGVRRVSQAITSEISHKENSRGDAGVKQIIVDRKSLIQRVVDAYQSKGIRGFCLERLEQLDFESADRIEVVRTFKGFERSDAITLDIDALQLDDVLYFSCVNGEYPWFGIARELAYVLYPLGDINSLGMELKEILSSKTFESANNVLDQLGYPRLEIIAESHVQGSTAQGIGGNEGSDTGENAGQHSNGNQTQSGEGKGTSSTNKDKEKEKSKEPKRKTSRLVSYVYPEDEISDKSMDEEAVNHRTKIADMGVQRVVNYEMNEKRKPTVMPPNNPGYDIKSVDQNGHVRYIEVKSLTNAWDSQSPAQMTRTEFRLAKELGNSYWLYVVELVEKEECKIYRIQDPGNKVGYYLFDHGWSPLSEK